MERPIRIAIVDEQEIFRRGVALCLAERDDMLVVHSRSEPPLPELVDVVLCSEAAAADTTLGRAVIVCAASTVDPELDEDPRVRGVLMRSLLTPEQLLGAVEAVAAGLVLHHGGRVSGPSGLDERSRDVLARLAMGHDTRAISTALGFSERTIKGIIHEASSQLGARNRTHAVAVGIRRGLI